MTMVISKMCQEVKNGPFTCHAQVSLQHLLLLHTIYLKSKYKTILWLHFHIQNFKWTCRRHASRSQKAISRHALMTWQRYVIQWISIIQDTNPFLFCGRKPPNCKRWHHRIAIWEQTIPTEFENYRKLTMRYIIVNGNHQQATQEGSS